MNATMADERARVVAEARHWVGTPYHPGADVIGAGVDCGMLIVRSFVDAGLVAPFDPRPYPPDWHLHRSDEKYLGFVRDHCREIDPAAAGPGDLMVFRYGRCHAHGALVTGTVPLTILHAFSPARTVIEEQAAFNPTLHARAPRAFSLWADGPGEEPR